MWYVALCISALVVVSITHWLYRWKRPLCIGTLPPGSMGWPFLGETLHFLASNSTSDIPPFINKRIQRYGSIFRTSLFGKQVIVSTDSELNNMVFQQEGKSFENWQPQSLTKLVGSQNVGCLRGNVHKYVRNMVRTTFGQESLKKNIAQVESVAKRNMEGWANKETVELTITVADVIFEVMVEKLISYDPKTSPENLRENFDTLTQGIFSLPFDIPGTAYHNCLQGRKKVMKMLKNMLKERRAKPNKLKNDFFDYVLEELMQNDTILTEAMAVDLVFGLLFASFETTSKTITLSIKFLTENPEALKELTEEHENILRKRENTESGLTWEEYKSMTFTFQIINEALRLGNVAPGLFRKAVKDIKYKGYTIPCGWVVMLCPPAVHLDPINYKDPLEFNPWRWEGMNIKGTSKTFMAFGGGLRFCAGADLARLQIAVFLHCLVTNYRWKIVRGGEILRNPGLKFPNGFHVHVFRKDEVNQEPTPK